MRTAISLPKTVDDGSTICPDLSGTYEGRFANWSSLIRLKLWAAVGMSKVIVPIVIDLASRL